MTTIETHAEAAHGSAIESFGGGDAAWSVTTDHKRIGRIYLGFGLLGLLAVSVLSVLLGIERASDSSDLFRSGSLLQLFQAQRVGLAFAGVIPLALGLSIAIVPLQLGARQIAYPRLALTGCYMWLGGLGLTFSALIRNGGIGGGDSNSVDLFLAGHGLMVVGLAASSLCVATSVLTTRAPGMTMRRVPLFAWSALIGALGMLIALPVLLGGVIYAFVDHRIGIQANFGTDGIGAWIAWAYSVPAVIVYAIPAVGVAAELMPVTFKHRQPMRGQIFAGIALVGVAALAVASMQRVHSISFDKSQQFGDFFDDLLPFLIFAGLPVLGLLMTMALGGLTAKSGLANGRPKITAAFLFADLGVAMILLGAVANAMQAITNLELLGTTFEEGATLLVVYGAAMAVFGGVLFWAPKLWGRVVPDLHSMPLVLLALGGTVLAAGGMIVAGFLDQAGGLPANDADVAAMLNLDYDSSAQLWNWVSLIGHGLMALATLAFVALMLKVFAGAGENAEANPYGGHTIEWSTTSPAPADNFEFVPTVASPSPVFDMTYEGTLP